MLVEYLNTYVVFLGGNMITFATFGANSSSSKTSGKRIEVYVDIDNGKVFCNLVESLSLSNSSGESVEKISVFAVVFSDSERYDFNY